MALLLLTPCPLAQSLPTDFVFVPSGLAWKTVSFALLSVVLIPINCTDQW